MAGERLSDGEIARRFDTIDKRIDRMVTVDSWTMGNDHLREKIAEVDKDCMEAVKRIEDGKQNAWVRALQLAGVVATVVVGWWTAYIASKGIK